MIELYIEKAKLRQSCLNFITVCIKYNLEFMYNLARLLCFVLAVCFVTKLFFGQMTNWKDE